MEIKQIASIINDAVTASFGGEATLANEDLTNLVDVGAQVTGARDVSPFAENLIDRIGRSIYDSRVYDSKDAPSLYMDNWTYGNIMQLVEEEPPEAQDDEAYQLTDGASYDENIYTAPSIVANYFKEFKAYMVPGSFTRQQMYSAFASADDMARFINMRYQTIYNALAKQREVIRSRVVCNMMALTYADATAKNQTGSGKTSVRSVNVLTEYNTEMGTSISATEAIHNPEFIRYASYRIRRGSKDIEAMTRAFNIGGVVKFSRGEYKHLLLLDDFLDRANTYLQSDTFHEQFTKLPNAESMNYWQGPGDFSFDIKSKIAVTPAGGTGPVTITGVIGCLYDRYAMGITEEKPYTESKYVNKGSFFNYWWHEGANYFNNKNAPFIMFYIA